MASYELTPTELRVLGALLEKQVTTPDQYPLTLKALVSACNQKSSRDPVMKLAEATVRETVAALERKYLLSQRTEYGSRVSKHRQRFCNTEFGTLTFTPAELAILSGLILRGPQTPGELRNRLQRMHPFADVHEVEEALAELNNREDGPWVVRLEREPGRRESRYAHLLGDEDVEAAATTRATPAPRPAAPLPASHPGDADSEPRLDRLERAVEALAVRVDALGAQLAQLEQDEETR